MITLLINFFAFIFAIGILVIFHEFGHFWMARRLGVKVLRFSVGFGKPLMSFRDKHHTEYVIAAIPLGGYVKMLDEREGEIKKEDKPFAYNRKPVWARSCILLAGPLANFIFAILAYWFMFMIGIDGIIPIIGEVKPGTIAAQVGLAAGQEIVAIDGSATPTWQQVVKQLMARLGDQNNLKMEVKDPTGTMHTYSFMLEGWELKDKKPNLLYALGILPYHPPIPPIIAKVLSAEPAAMAGVEAGDRIISVNGKPVAQWKDFTDVVVKSIDIPMQITVEREAGTKELTIIPHAKEDDFGDMIGFAGVVGEAPEPPKEMIRTEKLNIMDALFAAIFKTEEYIVLTFLMIIKMLKGAIGLHALSGPLSIAQGAGASIVVGIQYYFSFLGLLSISLGVLNLLPIPVLDGGHLLFCLIEAVTRRPISMKVQFYTFKVGMFILIFLMSIAFYNDITRLF